MNKIEQAREFHELAVPLINWLHKNCSYNSIVVVTPEGARILQEKVAVHVHRENKDD